MTNRTRTLDVTDLGFRSYADALALQEARLLEVQGGAPDTVFVVEHPPTITLGRAAKQNHILLSPEELAQRGVSIFEVGRGGDVTFHGPGQIVVYPIVNLEPDRKDVRKYVQMLEETMIRTCGDFGIEAHRIAGLNGAWITRGGVDRKIGAVGVRISRWVTMHGLAFNVSTDLSQFGWIVPCGIADKPVTNLFTEHLGAQDPGQSQFSIADVQKSLLKNLNNLWKTWV